MPVLEDWMRVFYSLIYTIKFCDGKRWMVKIPCNGTPERWDNLSKRVMDSEVETMRFLKKETTIPVPEVLAWTSTPDLMAGVPFIFMSYMGGVTLREVWNQEVKTKEDEERVGKSHALRPSIHHRGRIDSPRQLVQDVLARVLYQPDSNWVMYNEQKPTPCPKEWYESALDANPSRRPNHLQDGLVQLLRWMIKWMPEPRGYSDAFVLDHPNLSIANILVDEMGKVTAILD